MIFKEHYSFIRISLMSLLLGALSLNATQFSHVSNQPKPQPQLQSTIWKRLISGFSIPKPQNKRVLPYVKQFARNKTDLLKLSQKAQPYLYYILEELEARNMPSELALLPMIESRFMPHAYSNKSAVGIWQINPITRKHLGLKHDHWFDARKDLKASTQAALDYLSALNKEFKGNWFLTLAAYNSGGGTVRKAIRKNKKANKPTDYWSLPLPKETRQYVPKFLAMAHVFAHHKQYKLDLHPIPNTPFFQPVEVGQQIDLKTMAQLTGIRFKQLHQLNAGYKRKKTHPKTPQHVLVPVTHLKAFEKHAHQAVVKKRKH